VPKKGAQGAPVSGKHGGAQRHFLPIGKSCPIGSAYKRPLTGSFYRQPANIAAISDPAAADRQILPPHAASMTSI